MNTELIDEAIEKYVAERMKQGKKRASERFLAYVHLRHRGEELRQFLKKVGGLSRYYISYFKLLENPFKGPEIALLASMLIVGVFSWNLIMSDDFATTGILVFSTTLVFVRAIIAEVIKKWHTAGVMIAIYREIAEIAENEMASMA